MARFDCGKAWKMNTGQRRFLLALCWISGLLCGFFLFLQAGAPVVSLMRRILLDSVSIVSLFSIRFIPFLFTAYAVFISEVRLVFPICFTRAMIYAYVSLGIYSAFDSAGWLIRILVLFGDSLCMVVLYTYWLRLLSGQKTKCFAETMGVFLGFLLVCIADFYVISPYLASLIEI